MSDARGFTDSFGFQWRVVEIEAEESVGSTGAVAREGWLYFFSRGATRVLRQYPARWSELTWPDLEDLCAHGAQFGADRPRPAPHGPAVYA